MGCGRPLRPACPCAGICEGCEPAGLGGRRSPRGCPTAWLKLYAHLRLAAMRGRLIACRDREALH